MCALLAFATLEAAQGLSLEIVMAEETIWPGYVTLTPLKASAGCDQHQLTPPYKLERLLWAGVGNCSPRASLVGKFPCL